MPKNHKASASGRKPDGQQHPRNGSQRGGGSPGRRLTKRDVEALCYTGNAAAKQRCILWDTDPRGFGVRVFPSGRKCYVLSYRNLAGRKRLMSLGDYEVLKLDEARARAKAELVAIDQQHADPLADKAKRQLEARTGTIAEMYAAYVSTKLKGKNSMQWYADNFVLPTFGKRSWRDVRRSEVRDWHAGIDSDYNANRALQTLRAAYYWRLWAEDDSAGEQRKRDTRNPCAGIELRAERRRTVRLELAELPRLEKAIDAETTDPYMRAYFRFVLAVGSRKSEALKLMWSDVTLTGTTPAVVFRAHEVKGGDRTVPLSPYCVALLKRLPKVAGNPYVFVGRRDGEHLKSPAKAWGRIRERAGLKHVRIHDLRRTFGSWLGDAGFTSKQIGTVLGHKTDITSRVYMQLGTDSQREAVKAVDKLMKKARTPRRRANVVPLKAAQRQGG